MAVLPASLWIEHPESEAASSCAWCEMQREVCSSGCDRGREKTARVR